MVLTCRTSRIITPLLPWNQQCLSRVPHLKTKRLQLRLKRLCPKLRRARQDWDPVGSLTMGTICHRTLSVIGSLVWFYSAYLFPCLCGVEACVGSSASEGKAKSVRGIRGSEMKIWRSKCKLVLVCSDQTFVPFSFYFTCKAEYHTAGIAVLFWKCPRSKITAMTTIDTITLQQWQRVWM